MSADRAHKLRLVGVDLSERLVAATERLDMTTREQIVTLSMLLGGVLAMSHIPDDQARELGKQMVDAAILAVRAFQRATHS